MNTILIEILATGISLKPLEWHRLIINFDTDLNTPNAKGQTPLCVASSIADQQGAMEALLVAGADPNIPGLGVVTTLIDGTSKVPLLPLSHAFFQSLVSDSHSSSSWMRLSLTLLENGADLDAMLAELEAQNFTLEGRQLLQAKLDVLGTVRLILAAQPIVLPNMVSLIDILKTGIELTRAQWNTIIQVLGTNLNTPDAEGRTALCAAASRVNLEATQALLDSGADPNTLGLGVGIWSIPGTSGAPDPVSRCPLSHALLQTTPLYSPGSDITLALKLLEKSADLDILRVEAQNLESWDRQSLQAKLDVLDTVRSILAASKTAEPAEPLVLPNMVSLIDILKTRIELTSSEWEIIIRRFGPDLDIPNEQGQTALCVALDTVNEGAVEALLVAGANPNRAGFGILQGWFSPGMVPDPAFCSPLNYALLHTPIFSGSRKTLALKLLGAGAYLVDASKTNYQVLLQADFQVVSRVSSILAEPPKSLFFQACRAVRAGTVGTVVPAFKANPKP